MSIDQFRSAIRTRPFRSFTITTADGGTHTVNHPELVAITESGRTVFVTNEQGINVIDVDSIAKFHVSKPKPTGKRKSGE